MARLDKMRNAKGHLPTAELRRELQVSLWKFAPVHLAADDLPKDTEVIGGIIKEYKDVGIKDRCTAWGTDSAETVKLDKVINWTVQA